MKEQRKIPFSPPDIRQEDIEEVVEALKSGWITTGPRVKEFEKRITAFTGADTTVCLNSATACLELTLRIFGIGPGDEVIVPAYTYTASASVVDHVGAKLVLCDIHAEDLQMDLDQLERLITEKTKAIIPVDIGGIMENYEGIFDVVTRKKSLFHPSNDRQKALGRIAVLADGAHSLGAEQKGKRSGSVADFTSFSFHAVKNLTTAEGGAVSWRKGLPFNSEEIYHEYQLLSLHGQSKDALAKTKLGAWEYDIVMPGYKCNMTDIQAAIGLRQLDRYPQLLQRRRDIVDRYHAVCCEEYGCTDLAHFTEEASSSGHLYILRLPKATIDQRNRFITEMAKREVACNVHYKPLPMMTAYRNMGFDSKDFPNAVQFFVNEVTLPLHTCLSDEDVDYVLEAFRESFQTIFSK